MLILIILYTHESVSVNMCPVIFSFGHNILINFVSVNMCPVIFCFGYNISEVFHRTSSQMCGRWYLPMFLFRYGLLTLIYRASLMVLMGFWSSLPTILKLSMLIL